MRSQQDRRRKDVLRRLSNKVHSGRSKRFDPRLSYAREKFAGAVHVLATHPGNLKERLGKAIIEFIAVREGDCPDRVRPDFAWVMRKLTSKKPTDEGDGSIPATLHRMRLSTAQAIAERIVGIKEDLDSHYADQMGEA